MKKRNIIILYNLIIILIFLNSFGRVNHQIGLAQENSEVNIPVEEWNQVFGGTRVDRAWDMTETFDGGYLLAGLTESFGAGRFDMWLVKTDENGIEQWNYTYGGPEVELILSVIETNDNDILIVGGTESFGFGKVGSHDIWMVKTDSNGIELWNHTFGGKKRDLVFDVIETADGGYLLAGDTESFGSGSKDIWLIKTDENGIEQWNHTFGGTEEDNSRAVIETFDRGYLVAGETESFGSGSKDIWLIKTDENGIEQWNHTFGGTEEDRPWAIIETTDGGYLVAGETASFGTGILGKIDMWLVKTDSNGIEQWNQSFGGTKGSEIANDVIETDDGGYLLVGVTTSFGAGSTDMWLVKVGNRQKDNQISGFLIIPLLIAIIVLLRRPNRSH